MKIPTYMLDAMFLYKAYEEQFHIFFHFHLDHKVRYHPRGIQYVDYYNFQA